MQDMACHQCRKREQVIVVAVYVAHDEIKRIVVSDHCIERVTGQAVRQWTASAQPMCVCQYVLLVLLAGITVQMLSTHGIR